MPSLVCNSGAYTIVGAASITSWQLSIASGSYALTGTVATLIHGHPITAVSGVYSLTGTPIRSRRIAIEPAGYILNGTAVTLTKSNKFIFSVASGSYAITGTTATQVEKGVPYTKGVYALTGTTVNLVRSSAAFRIPITVGSYSLVGQVVGLLSTVTISSGDYGITGGITTLRGGKSLQAVSGSYQIANTPTTRLEQSRHFPCTVGAYAITGAITTLRRSTSIAIFIVANATNYALTGVDASLLLNRRVDAVSGSYVISDGHTVFRKQYDSGSYTLTGTAANLLVGNRRLTAAIGSYSLTGSVTALVYSIHILSAVKAAYSISGPITNIRASRILSVAGGSYGLTGSTVTLRATRVMVDVGLYALTGTDATLSSTHTSRWTQAPSKTATGSTQPVATRTWDTQPTSPGVV